MKMDLRNIIAKALGAFWILDGLLQFQPLMFGPEFTTDVLEPLFAHQPVFLHVLIQWGIDLWNTNTIITNGNAAMLQIAIGILLFFPLKSDEFKWGAWVSIVWGFIVWICGEGAGDLFTGNATFYTGAPGAVLIYMLLAWLLLNPEKFKLSLYPKIAGWLFLFGALLQLQPGFWSSDGVGEAFMTSMMDPVQTVAVIPNAISVAAGLTPVVANLLLTAFLLIIGLAILLWPNKITGSIALVFLFFVWWFGQDFGELSTLIVGVSTDPNSAPLIALLLLPLFTFSPPNQLVDNKT